MTRDKVASRSLPSFWFHLQGDQYQDRWRYRDSKQEKKKGFLTSDFSKRDEFSNTIRTGQWREQLKVSAHEG